MVGESGSGKSTLIRLLLGLQPPSRGSVRYDGAEVSRLSGASQRTFRREVQAIFQDPFAVYNPFYRVDHALMTPMRAFGLVRSRDEGYARIETTLQRVGLRPEETLGKYPHQLSGGQRQRVMIARALLLDPQIILADEPVSMVDASLRSTILEILFGLNRDLGISLIYVTHDLATAYQVADTIVVLHGGHILEVAASLYARLDRGGAVARSRSGLEPRRRAACAIGLPADRAHRPLSHRAPARRRHAPAAR